MTRREELLENYEDALFAILMDEVAESEGQKYLEMNERLRNDPSAEIPKRLSEKCRRIIRRSFSKKRRYEASRTIKLVVNRAAVIVLISAILFTVAYALVPEVRIRTLNLLIEVSDVATSLTFGNDNGSIASEVPEKTYYGYVFPKAPEGFQTTDEGHDSRTDWIRYENNEGAMISISIGGSGTSIISADTEDADSVEAIIIHGFEGILIEKSGSVQIVWGDTGQEKIISVSCEKFDKETVISFVNEMRQQIK